MFNKKRALNYILNVASNNGYSQAKLIDGIFDISHFNRMCNGKENINIEVIFACADKLGIPYDDFFKNSSTTEQFNLEYYKDEFYRLVHIQDYNEVLKLYNIISTIHSDNSSFIQFKLVVKAFIEWKIKENIETAKSILFEALKVTIINFNGDLKTINYDRLLSTEISIINDIAICKHSTGNFEESIYILELLLSGLENSKITNEAHIKYIYNLSLFLIHNKNFSKAIKYIDIGIKKSITTNNFLYLLPLYYNSFILNYLNNNKKSSEVLLEKCYSLSLLQNKNSKFITALKDDIDKFNINDTFILKYI